MQNKGAIRLFAIALVLVSLYQLSFTWVTYSIRQDAKAFAKNDPGKEQKYLDSISEKEVYNFVFLRKYTYKECLDREINLGLDLKGGMNVTLAISIPDLLKAMSNNSTDSTFNRALNLAKQRELSSREDFVSLFGKAFEEIAPNAKLAVIFQTIELKDRINFASTNQEVLKILNGEINDAIDNSFNVLRSRIDKFGVTQPNIQKLEASGRILVELPGVKEPERVRKLLQGTANLEFWETYNYPEVYKFVLAANEKLREILKGEEKIDTSKTQLKDSVAVIAKDSSKVKKEEKEELSILKKLQDQKSDTVKKDSNSIVDKLANDSTKSEDEKMKNFQKENPLHALLIPKVDNKNNLVNGASMGYAHRKDTAQVRKYLNIPSIKALFPRGMRSCWAIHPTAKGSPYYELIPLKSSGREGTPALSGDVITNARADFGQGGGNAEVSMSMNGKGASEWARITNDNIGKQIAIVLDNFVYSNPVVNGQIKGGNSQISGDFSIAEAKDLANILKSGRMPAPVRIIEESIVGPSLGKEAISAGLISFLIAFICVLLYMSLYYNRAGHVADIALFANVFFLFGVLASFNAVLTLPGIAGIVLTLAMAVDSNVIIYERMREELRAGKGMQLVVKDGFWHAYSAIIDGHVTTILTGVVLYIFGTGPVQGFATTLIIGLLLSLFSSIFIARLIFEWMLRKKMDITLGNKITNEAFTKTKFNFMSKRKVAYIFSWAVIGIGIISLFIRGLSPGVDFAGGRSFTVRFDRDVVTQDIRDRLAKEFGEMPEVKTFGPDNQVKITTKYMINDNNPKIDSIVEDKLYAGLSSVYSKKISAEEFKAHSDTKKIGILSSQKVGAVVATDMIYKAFMAIFFSLIIIFVYIGFRFKNWQFGLGGVIALFHDTMIVVTMFSLFYGILPFSLDVDQSFIAALLTVIGYSIMDTVIIFDRIREYRGLHPKWDLAENINAAINSTLGRTINTSGITFVTLVVIFIFGGEMLRGFIFAMLVGIVIGTYSSVFVATPIAYDIIKLQEKNKEKKALKEKGLK